MGCEYSVAVVLRSSAPYSVLSGSYLDPIGAPGPNAVIIMDLSRRCDRRPLVLSLSRPAGLGLVDRLPGQITTTYHPPVSHAFFHFWVF